MTRNEEAAQREAQEEQARVVVVHLSNGGTTVLDEADLSQLPPRKWFRDQDGYVRAAVGGKQVSMHRLILSAPPGAIVDHINRNRADNRRENLRIVTSAESGRNQGPKRGRYRGASFHTRSQRWRGTIYLNGKNQHLGWFDTEEEAARAWDRAARESWGLVAFQNFLPTEGSHG